VGTVSPSGTPGRHPLSTRFTARVRIAALAYPSPEELLVIYTSMVKSSFGASPDRAVAAVAASAPAVARFMVEAYGGAAEALGAGGAGLPADAAQQHCALTPRDLTDWVEGLQRYALGESVELWEAVAHEGCRVFRDRLAGGDARAAFDAVLAKLLRAQGAALKVPPAELICSTLGASTEERLSGEAGRLRLAKWAPAAFRGLVSEHLKAYERETKELGMLLFPEVLRSVAAYDRCGGRARAQPASGE